MNPNDVAPALIAIVLFVTAGMVLILRGPLGKAIARRLEGPVGAAPELESKVADLEARLAELEQDRVELAERVDFAERMLLQVKEAPKELPR